MDMVLVLGWLCEVWLGIGNAGENENETTKNDDFLGEERRGSSKSSFTSNHTHHHHRPRPPMPRHSTRLACAAVSGDLGAVVRVFWCSQDKPWGGPLASLLNPPSHLTTHHHHHRPAPQTSRRITALAYAELIEGLDTVVRVLWCSQDRAGGEVFFRQRPTTSFHPSPPLTHTTMTNTGHLQA